jgi:hypothetical protein
MYSGWGTETKDMNPEDLAYSRIRMIAELIMEESQVNSDMMYNFHGFAHKSKTLYVIGGSELDKNWRDEYKGNEPDQLHVLRLPEGASPDHFKVDESQLFDEAAFAYAGTVANRLASEFPAPIRGMATGTSGRQEDILRGAGLSVYDCAVDNTAKLWARAFEKSLKVMKSMDLIPDGVSKKDIEKVKSVTVTVKADDPIERDRLITMGRVLVNEGKRSLKTFLIKDMGMTEEEAEEEMIEIDSDAYMRNNPEIAQFIGFKAAQQSGMADELEQYKQMVAQQGQAPPITSGGIGSQGGEPRSLNIKTPTGAEQVDVALTQGGARRGPSLG